MQHHLTRDVSVVVAAHDEGPSIGAVVRGSLASSPRVLEVLVVDDGSTDDTAEAATSAGARVLRLPRNLGKGGALRKGIAAAAGSVLVFLDGDGQDDPREIGLLLRALEPDVDLVIGSRFLGDFQPGAITTINRAGNRLLTEVLNTLFGTRVTDTQAGFRAARRELLLGLRLCASAYDIETDMLLRVLRAGGRVVEIPVSRGPREHGRSGLHAARDCSRILGCIVRHRVTASLAPLRGTTARADHPGGGRP